MANRTVEESDRQTRGQSDVRPEPVATISRRLSPMQLVAVTRERILWNHRADTWDDAGSAGLSKVVEAVLDASHPGPDTVAIDLGCGSGQVTIPLARACRRMLAVDVSAPLVARLERKARDASVANITTIVAALERLDLSPGSVDLVVSNY
ncbi:MAG TPA: class I SAM-dependent methyltransferase, partial [Solirubrobacteraceae bacterium]|nr:class I SAM-dependent methyltransferase [Solirubrobacteraceae bacterium]